MGFSKNHKKKNWCFLLCFRPIVNEECSLIKPIKEKQQESKLLPQKTILFSFSNDQIQKPTLFPPVDDKIDVWKSPRRRFPQVIKAIFSSKKKRNKISEKEISRKGSNISTKFQKIFDTSCEKKSKSILSSTYYKDSLENSVSSRSSLFSSSTLGNSSKRSSSSSSSSSISSMVSNSRTGSPKRQISSVDLKELTPNKKEIGNFNSDIGFYSMLICLFGLIFLGKVFAILCTSICLIMAPCLYKVDPLEENGVDPVDFNSDEYKKKVIMEGLLDRSRTRKL